MAANKMTVIKALMSLKHEVDLSWEAKREVINAIADNALASFVLIQLAIKRCGLCLTREEEKGGRKKGGEGPAVA